MSKFKHFYTTLQGAIMSMYAQNYFFAEHSFHQIYTSPILTHCTSGVATSVPRRGGQICPTTNPQRPVRRLAMRVRNSYRPLLIDSGSDGQELIRGHAAEAVSPEVRGSNACCQK